MSLLSLLATFAAVFATAPADPPTATASAEERAGASVTRSPEGRVVWLGGPGAESVLLGRTGDAVVISDGGASANVPAGCERVADTLTCAATSVVVDLGAGDDSFDGGELGDLPLTVRGGPGDDTLSGSSGDDALYGDEGDDVIQGGDGSDVVDGGAGADELFGGAGDDRVWGRAGDDVVTADGATVTGRDLVDGGPGVDTLSGDYSVVPRPGPLLLTLADGADDGYPGEGDDVRGFEVVVVESPGRVVGTDGPEELRAVGARDERFTLVGAGGHDVLVGGDGPDRLDGGAGDDRILAEDGVRDAITCGPGRDIAYADSIDRVARDCEIVRRSP